MEKGSQRSNGSLAHVNSDGLLGGITIPLSSEPTPLPSTNSHTSAIQEEHIPLPQTGNILVKISN